MIVRFLVLFLGISVTCLHRKLYYKPSFYFGYPSSQDTIWHFLRTKVYFLETSTLTEALICKLCSSSEWLRNNHKGPGDTLQTQTNKERLFKVVVLHFHPALSCYRGFPMSHLNTSIYHCLTVAAESLLSWDRRICAKCFFETWESSRLLSNLTSSMWCFWVGPLQQVELRLLSLFNVNMPLILTWCKL